MQKTIILLICSVFLSSCLDSLFVSSEEACNFSQYKGQRIAWKSLPVNLFVDDSLNALQRHSITEAVEAIHTQYNKVMFNVIFGVEPSDAWQSNWVKYGVLPKDGKSSVYWISTAWPRKHAAKQAITRTNYKGSSIRETDIVINTLDYALFLVNPSRIGIDLKSLYIHELLHSAGLKHIIEDPDSVMNPQLAYGPQPQRRILSSLDKESLRCEYK